MTPTQQADKPATGLLVILHPFLFALFPPVSVWSIQPSQVLFWELGATLAAALLIAGLMMVVMRVLLHDWAKAAVGATCALVWFYSYGYGNVLNIVLHTYDLPLVTHRLAVTMGAVAMFGGLFYLYCVRELSAKLVTGLNTIAVCAMAGPLFYVCLAAATSPTAFRSEVPAGTPTPPVFTLEKPAKPRDIYYLVFDRYARADTLQNQFDYDNQPFLDELRKRGFFVAEQARANYPKTEISMSSALNMKLHGDTVAPKSHYIDLIHNNAAGRALKGAGYRYYHLGVMLDGIRWNPQADFSYRFSYMPTEFTDVMSEFTAAFPMIALRGHRDRVLEKLDILEHLPTGDRSQPKFVYGHFLVPHEPWKFNADGSDAMEISATRSNRENYRQQLAYTNKRILELLDKLQSGPGPAPIIVIQADEGPELKYAGDRELPPLEKIRKRTGILSAYYLPERDAEGLVAADVTPVNSLRIVFNTYFNAKLPLIENRSFYWEHPTVKGKPNVLRITKLLDVTGQLTAPESASAPEPAVAATGG